MAGAPGFATSRRGPGNGATIPRLCRQKIPIRPCDNSVRHSRWFAALQGIFMRSIILAAVSLTALSAAARAAEFSLESKIDAVTVFPDAAMVTRLGKISIPAGSHTLVLQGLPPEADPSSIRIEASADTALLIGSAETRAAPASMQPDTAMQKKLRDLRLSLADMQGQIEAADMQKRTIEKSGLGEKDKPLDIQAMRALWSAVGEATADINGRLVQLRQRAADLDAEIKSLEAAMQRPRSGQPRTDLTVAIEAEKDARADLKITYRVRNARWAPLYDARLDTGNAQVKPKLELVRRASIMQRTGEDWGDAEVTLSTTRVSGSAAAPDLPTLALNIYEPAIVMMERAPARAAAPAPRQKAEAGMTDAERAGGNEEMKRMVAQEQGAALVAGDFSAEYKVPGRISVTRDGAQKNVGLASRDYAPDLIAKAVPALEPRAYLSARLVNAEEAPLLAGEVNVFRDGVFVGKTRMAQTAPGDALDFGFGADEKIKVERVPMKKRENDPSWPASSKFQISDFKTTVTNLHGRPMKISVIDRIPVSENSAITVETLRETTAATEKQVADKRGVMGWTWDMQPNEKKEIRVAWRIRWPADRDITFNGALR